MRILVAHNLYQQHGGEETVVAAETELLRAHGHEVELMTRDNREVPGMGRLALAVESHWSRRTAADLAERIRAKRPDVVHVHNTFPLLSPSVYWTARAAGVPVVKTLHNFRLLCIQGSMLRNGARCTECVDGAWLPGLEHRCYRDSFAQSAVATSVRVLHRAAGTYLRKVDAFIVMSRFAREMLTRSGIPAERLHVKPNFVPDADGPEMPRSGLLFVGRLTEEKGVGVLAALARAGVGAPLEVLGDGPMRHRLESVAGLTLHGRQPPARVSEAMRGAIALLLPSIVHEGCPMVVLEAFSRGLPVIASRLDPLPEFIEDGVTGLLFEPGDPADLGAKVRWALEHPREMARMGQAARETQRTRYTARWNHDALMAVYETARERAGGARRAA